VTIPDNEGIDYTVDGEKVEGELDIPEDGLIIEAEPQPGYSIDEDETTEWSYDYYPSVTPEEPTRDGNTVTIPDTDGIDYTRDNEIITGTIEIPEDGVNIVAIAKDGYELDGNNSWTFDYEQEEEPSEEPSDNVTEKPTEEPSDNPSESPSDEPSVTVPVEPSVEPTQDTDTSSESTVN